MGFPIFLFSVLRPYLQMGVGLILSVPGPVGQSAGPTGWLAGLTRLAGGSPNRSVGPIVQSSSPRWLASWASQPGYLTGLARPVRPEGRMQSYVVAVMM